MKQGDFVTIGLPNSIEFYEATVATWKLGIGAGKAVRTALEPSRLVVTPPHVIEGRSGCCSARVVKILPIGIGWATAR